MAELNRRIQGLTSQFQQFLDSQSQPRPEPPRPWIPPSGTPGLAPYLPPAGAPPPFPAAPTDPELQALQAGILQAIQNQPPAWLQALVGPVMEVRQAIAAQQQQAIRQQGQQRLAEITQRHPIFADPVWGRHAQRELSELYAVHGRTTSVEELAEQAARQIELDRYNDLQNAARGGQVDPRTVQGAGAAVQPGQGAGPTVVAQEPRNLREATTMVMNRPLRPMPGQQ